MEREGAVGYATMGAEGENLREELMVPSDRWKEIRRLRSEEGVAIAELARRFDLDRKTVRRCLKDEEWRPYRRERREDTLLATHAEYLRGRAPHVEYSAQVLFQELGKRGYKGSYETVKRFVRPLRDTQLLAERASVRFETPPGYQSQIDWGSARVHFRHRRVVLHVFVLTLGYSRRGFYDAFLNEQLPQFLDAHERAFDHFGGHTREHLYDRPRTVCLGTEQGRPVWNTTFKSFADYWGFEPRLCRAYRAQTKGKVESGVKYVKRNFLVGRSFADLVDVREQMAAWNAEIADVRIHGTTHERPIDRFPAERSQLVPLAPRAGYRLEATYTRVVADDFLVTLDTNRYSVPFALIGQTVQVQRREGQVRIFHRDRLVVSHEELTGRYQIRILPEHGPGAVARAQRHRRSTPPPPGHQDPRSLEVEVRDLAAYEAACAQGGEA